MKQLNNLKSIIFFTFVIVASTLFSSSSAQAAVPSGNYIELFGGYLKATNPNLVTPAGFTFEGWVKPDSISGSQTILSIGDKNLNQYRYEITLSSGTLGVKYRFTGGTYSVTSGTLLAGVWSHIAVSISSQTAKVYINGIQVPVNISSNVSLSPIGGTIIMGNSFQESFFQAPLFKGKLDEIRISNISREIQSAWNADLYQNPLVADDNTLLLWHIDEARGVTTAFDVSSNSLSGSLIGNDSLIHFFGVLPSPTPTPTPSGIFIGIVPLPQIRWTRPVLPTIEWPNFNQPPFNPTPTTNQSNPTPTSSDPFQFSRTNRPIFSR